MYTPRTMLQPGVVLVVLLALVLALGLGLRPAGAQAVGEPGGSEQSQGHYTMDILHSDNRGIAVSGSGEVTVEPDLAVISLGVEERAATVAEARDAAAQRMSDLLLALQQAGVAEGDIQTSQFQISPEYQWTNNETRLIGFRVSNMLTVEVRDLDNVGPVLDAAAAAGGDATRINGITFTLDDAAAAENEARRLAVADAIAKADLYAEALGVTRGRVLSLAEVNQGRPLRMESAPMAMAGEAAVSTPIVPGELDIIITIEVVFYIQ